MKIDYRLPQCRQLHGGRDARIAHLRLVACELL